MNTEREAADGKSSERHALAADRGSSIVITVTPDRRPGRCRAYVGSEQELLCVSRQPLLDGARKLIAMGHYPSTMVVMRWAGAKEWALRGPLGVAAKLTVDEHNGTFGKWKALSRSAVPPGNASSTRRYRRGRIAEKPIPENTAEQRRRTDLSSVRPEETRTPPMAPRQEETRMTKPVSRPKHKRTEMLKGEGMSEFDVERWLATKKEAGLEIDPETAEVRWEYGQVMDPYGVHKDLPEECWQVGRQYFARSLGSDIWVHFHDLPDDTRDALWKRHQSKLAFPAGLEELLQKMPQETGEG
jgi:hypothetical protein